MTPNAKIPLVPQNTNDPAAGLNAALNVIDVQVQTAVISMALTAPPGAPQDGDLYIPAAPATGLWAGLENHVVRYVTQGTFWQSYAPGDPMRLVINLADGNLYMYLPESPGGWILVGGGSVAGSAPVVTESGTSLTATEADSGEYTRFTNASAKTYEFDDAEGYQVNDEYHGRNVGAGDLTIVEGGSMTVNPPAGGSLVIPQGGTFTVKIVASDEADLFGVTSP